MSSYMCEELEKKISNLIKDGEEYYKKFYSDKHDIELQLIKDIQAELEIVNREDAKQIYKIIKYKNIKQD